MGLTHTRTHTCYWAGEEIDAVDKAIEAVYASYLSRRAYISVEAKEAMEARLGILRNAAALCRDKAD